MEAALFRITLWSFFAGMIAHFLSLYPKEGSKAGGRLLVLAYVFIIIGFASLTTTILSRWIVQARIPISSSYEYLSVLAWCVAVLYFIVMYRMRSMFIGACISPGLFLAVVFAGLYPKRLEMTLIPALQSYWLKIHVTMTIVGEAAFALAFLAGILYLIKNVRWDETSSTVKRKSLLLFVATLIGAMIFVLVLRFSGLVLTEVRGLKAFMVLLGGGFLTAIPFYLFFWRKWISPDTGNFGGLVFALAILSLMVTGMSLGSLANRNRQQLENYMRSIRAVDELTGLLNAGDTRLTREAWQNFIESRREKLDLLLRLEDFQAEKKRALTQADAAEVLAGNRFPGEFTFPLSLGEIREESYLLSKSIVHLEEIVERTGLPAQVTALRALRNRLINNYNSVFARDILPYDKGRVSAFIGYMFMLAIPVFVILYFLSRSIQSRVPELETLDSLAYRSVSLGFPIFTFGALIAGAIWAHYAWGKWWSNDPKEVGSLIVWLTFLIYLHARHVRLWSGNQAAVAAILGFLFAVLSFVGNSVLGGLHAYG
jgi:ABC-type transport system involved in cytochrome c biogenesis permease subunit